MDLEVVGIINSADPTTNRNGIYMPLETAAYYLEMEGEVTELALKLSSGREVEEAELLKASLAGKGTEVLNWRELAYNFIALVQAKSSSSGTILFLIFLIAAVGISNTMLMSFYERMAEIGMMRAMGMTGKSIRGLFMLEAGGIGFLGALLGIILGALANIYMVNTGIDYSSIVREGDIGYRILGIAYGVWKPSSYVIAGLSGMILAGTVSFLSIRKAVKKEITECLRHNK